MRTLPPFSPVVVRVFVRFEIVAPVRFGLVCFRLKATDAANEELRHERVLFWDDQSSGRICAAFFFFGPLQKHFELCLKRFHLYHLL